jgi:hypothetical protein
MKNVHSLHMIRIVIRAEKIPAVWHKGRLKVTCHANRSESGTFRDKAFLGQLGNFPLVSAASMSSR